ncbi:MAG: DNA polymerase II [Gammaproteobacteria bacterium]|nr:DNA polymerase II [Gammaproteobacteria bacterium]MDP6166243.1 DNA polymerase II [Gammaproteobacteria bacterium]
MHGFLLTRHHQDSLEGLQLDYWLATDQGAVCVQQNSQQRVCFIDSQQQQLALSALQKTAYADQQWQLKPVALKCFSGHPALALYVSSEAIWRQLRPYLQTQGVELMEADIRPHERFLMERFVTGAVQLDRPPKAQINGAFGLVTNARIKPSQFTPNLRCVSLDIETTMNGQTIHSIALFAKEAGGDVRKVWLHWPSDSLPVDLPEYTEVMPNERQMLRQFVHWLESYDPDVFMGWSLVQFDFRILCQRAKELGVRLRLGRGGEEIHWRAGHGGRPARLFMPGRVALDGIEVMRAATWQFESFALEYVAQKLLGRGKEITKPHERGAEIQRLYAQEPHHLVSYNLEDCRLVWDIFAKAGLLDFVLARSQLTGLPMDRIGGSAQAFDHLYLPRLHRAGWVAPAFASGVAGDSPGGFVMDSVPGLYSNVLILDFKSLYPSIIRSFMIDPLGLITGADQQDAVAGFKGASFSRHDAILPTIIATLWQARDKAKAAQNTPLSTSIKIVMNACYGVLGSNQCRFYDQRLASSITQRGHAILKQTKVLIEAQGYKVIYGDTDSVFVWLGDKTIATEVAQSTGQALAADLNGWWQAHLQSEYQLTSYLEIEFETLFKRFVMPTIRGLEVGSKKRYAGQIVQADGSLKTLFKGLENVRTDWTLMARELQQRLYDKVFANEPYEDLITGVMADIYAGVMDDKLVYRKRIRRPLLEYRKNIPPHVQAANKTEQWLVLQGQDSRYKNGGWIEYVITKSGPQSVDMPPLPLDYEHYVERQLMPVVDGILNLLGDSFERLAGQQLGLFE